jgi:cobalt-zinc-cadmium efflux system membrane fusion protein
MKQSSKSGIHIILAVVLGAVMGGAATWYVRPLVDVGQPRAEPAHAANDHHDDHEAEASALTHHEHDDHHGSDNVEPEPLDHDAQHDHGSHHAEEHEDDHADHEGARVIHLSPQQREAFGIAVGVAREKALSRSITVPGQIVINADRVAHIVPRVSGVARQVSRSLGDAVQAGDVLAVLESAELAEAKAAFLAATERAALAESNFQREAELWKKKLSSEQEYLIARQAKAEAEIQQRAAEQRLRALGLDEDRLGALSEEDHARFALYEIVAPFAGTIVEKHIALGELLKDDSEAFVVADMSTVWVDLSVFQRDLPHLRKGRPVVIGFGEGMADARGVLDYISPLVDQRTRTIPARVVLDNTEGLYRPGAFVSARILLADPRASVVVPHDAVQTIDEQPCVFLPVNDGFTPQRVVLGHTTDSSVEVVSGLSAGQLYVEVGAFELKAHMITATMDSHAGHGH